MKSFMPWCAGGIHRNLLSVSRRHKCGWILGMERIVWLLLIFGLSRMQPTSPDLEVMKKKQPETVNYCFVSTAHDVVPLKEWVKLCVIILK